MKPLSQCRIAIVGLGLMGGSLAGALRAHCRDVTGVARRPETVEDALRFGLIDHGTTNPEDALPHADVVILATPVRTIIRQIREFAPMLGEGCLLMDLGSTKQEIIAAMEELPRRIQPLGGHPMCGKEVAGIAEADPVLYRGCTFILVPLERTSAAALALGQTLVEAVGSSPLVLDGERQDRLVATLSHLPYLLACSLVQTADASTSNDPAAWEIVAGGYRDTSRVAGSDVTMMMDILITNRRAVLDATETFQRKLAALVDLLEAEDEAGLKAALAAGRAERRRMFP